MAPIDRTPSAAQPHDCNEHMVELDDGFGWDCSICWGRPRARSQFPQPKMQWIGKPPGWEPGAPALRWLRLLSHQVSAEVWKRVLHGR